MPTFAYKGFASGGKSASGVIDAPDRKGAVRKLRAQGVSATDLKQKAAGGRAAKAERLPAEESPTAPVTNSSSSGLAALFRPKSGKKLALPMFRKLLQLHSSGMPIGDAMHLMSQRMTDPAMKTLSEDLYRDLSEGRTLAVAMRSRPEIFDEVQAHLIEAGEATGNLKPILENIISSLEAGARLKKEVQQALAYPIFTSTDAQGVIGLFLFYLLPQIQTMMTQMGGELNLATKIMVGFAEFALKQGPFILGGLLFATFAILQWRKSDKGRLETDRWLLHLPLIKDLAYNTDLSRLTNVVSILLGNGVNTTETLRLSSAVLRNQVLLGRFQAARTLINDGAPFSVAMQRHGLLPDVDIDILGIGESVGSLVDSFDEIYRTRSTELTAKLKFSTGLISGLALAFAFTLVFVLVLGIVLSILGASQTMLAR